MKTKIVVCDDPSDMIQGPALIAEYYKTYDPVDGHKIFLVNRQAFYQLTNAKENVNPPEEREIIFAVGEIVNEILSRKKVESQLSISRITRGRNSRNVCEGLIDWLLCKEEPSNIQPL